MTAKKPLEIDSRLCLIDHFVPRTENHGDEEVPALTVRLKGIILTKQELIRLTGDPQAWNLMFEQAKAGAPVEPTMQWCDGWRYLNTRYFECSSTIRFGMLKTEHEFDNHKIKDVAVRALTGGNAECMLSLQTAVEDTRITAYLHEYKGREAHIAVCFGKVDAGERKQGKLALNDTNDGDAEGRDAKKNGDTGGDSAAVH